MKKNGFTLIEIIGAIVILGIIAIIAFATYTTSLRGFRNNYYTREVKTVEKSAEEFFTDNRNYRPTMLLNAQEVTIGTLMTQDYIEKVVDYNGDNCDNESYVIVVKEGQDNYSYHACLICSNDGYDNTNEDMYCDRTWLDPTKVEYGIGEASKIYIYKGTTREDLKEMLELPISYIRKNNNGEEIAQIRGSKEGHEVLNPIDIDSVNTDVIGTYKVTYQYGSEEKQREVEVYENAAPTISMLKKENVVASSLSGGTTTTQDNYTSGDWAQSVIVTIETTGHVVDDESIAISKIQWNVDGRWEEFCSTSSCERKLETEMNQIIQFRSIDVNGNVSLLTEPIQIKIDRTSPRCTLTIPTTIGSNSWYKTDVNISISEMADQKSSDDNSLVSGIRYYNIQNSTDTFKNDATTNSKTHNSDTSGVTYKGYVEDEAGNFGFCEITFKRDATSPGCTNSGDSTTWTTSNRTIKWGCSDSLSECDPNYSGGSKTFSTTTETAEIAAYTIKDKAGNSKNCPKRTANVYVRKEVTCAAGKYLPKDSSSCAKCTKNYYCVGGTFTPSSTKDQGIKACKSGYSSSAGQSRCQKLNSATCCSGVYIGGHCVKTQTYTGDGATSNVEGWTCVAGTVGPVEGGHCYGSNVAAKTSYYLPKGGDCDCRQPAEVYDCSTYSYDP